MILDHVDNLSLSAQDVDREFESRMALARLSEGLSWINSEIIRIQNAARKMANDARDDQGKIPLVVTAGGILDKIPLGVLSGAFNWYAVSACNYAQLVGWMIFKDGKQAKSYVKRVMPRIYTYRNKIAAHLAITDPYQNDNEADLAASLLTSVVFLQGYFFAGAMEPTLQNESEKVNVSNKMSWSLTIAHKRLEKRWWPNGHEKSYPSIKLGAGETKNFTLDWSYIKDDVV